MWRSQDRIGSGFGGNRWSSMKRVLALVAAVAMTGSAYAQIPITLDTRVYTFEANVRNTNVKTIQVRVPSPITITQKVSSKYITVPVEVKYVENTRLYGYVIDGDNNPWDDDVSRVWAVIANANIRPAVGHLFQVTPVEMKMFDPNGGIYQMMADRAKAAAPTKLFDYTFGAEGGFIMNQGEDWEGDNVLGDPTYYVKGSVDIVGPPMPVNEDYLFGPYDTAGSCWLFGVGFGTVQVVFNDAPVLDFDLNMTGSIIGGWRDNAWGGEVDWQFCGSPDWETEDIFGAYGRFEPARNKFEPSPDMFRMSSWIAGTFKLTHVEQNDKAGLRPIYDPWSGQYGPSFTAAALKRINKNQFLDDPWDYDQYP